MRIWICRYVYEDMRIYIYGYVDIFVDMTVKCGRIDRGRVRLVFGLVQCVVSMLLSFGFGARRELLFNLLGMI